jgi:predicted NUDIX family NTP pyrophosphohydrolase
MKKQSAGILLYRADNKKTMVFLVHLGGPFWKNKDDGSWSIPKGEFTDNEKPEEAARREFREETGFDTNGDLIPLTPQKQKSGKVIYGFAVEGKADPAKLKSNTFEIEWPPESGRKAVFPEVDKGAWFELKSAFTKIQIGQRPFLEELEKILKHIIPE